MSFDDVLKNAWQGERPVVAPARLASRVRRRRLQHRLQRGVEIGLTLVAAAVCGRALAGGDIDPMHWLLLPFFAVYLPMAWAFILRAPRPRREDVSENARLYARLRMSQLRVNLRDLWLARSAAWSLLAYAIAVNAGAWALGDVRWRSDAARLLLCALVWAVGTLWLSRRWRSSLLRGYRAMRRLAGT